MSDIVVVQADTDYWISTEEVIVTPFLSSDSRLDGILIKRGPLKFKYSMIVLSCLRIEGSCDITNHQ